MKSNHGFEGRRKEIRNPKSEIYEKLNTQMIKLRSLGFGILFPTVFMGNNNNSLNDGQKTPSEQQGDPFRMIPFPIMSRILIFKE